MSEKNENIIETIDDEGKNVSFELLDVITVDDKEYALLLPADFPEDYEGDNDEAVIMRLKKEGEEFSFEAIEDDEEFEKVARYVEEAEDEIED